MNNNEYTGKALGDLTEEEYETLGERAYDDDKLITEYLELNADKLEEYCYEMGIDLDYMMDVSMNFVEANDDDYFQFAFNHYKEESK